MGNVLDSAHNMINGAILTDQSRVMQQALGFGTATAGGGSVYGGMGVGLGNSSGGRSPFGVNQ